MLASQYHYSTIAMATRPKEVETAVVNAALPSRGHGPFVRCSNDSWRVLGTFRKRVVVGKFGV